MALCPTMKYEFINDSTHQFYVVEVEFGDPKPTPRNPKDRFLRKWLAMPGAEYKIARLKKTTSKYINTLLTKGGNLKIKRGEHL